MMLITIRNKKELIKNAMKEKTVQIEEKVNIIKRLTKRVVIYFSDIFQLFIKFFLCLQPSYRNTYLMYSMLIRKNIFL